MLIAFMLGFTWLPGWRGAAMLLLAAAAFPLFMRWETRSAHPIFQARLVRGNTVFAFSNLAALVNYSATFAISFLLSLYLQYIKGFTPRTAGLVLIAQPVVMALFSPLAGRLSDRLEPRVVSSLGMGLCAAGLFAFAWLGRTSGLGFIVAALVLVGFGFALFSSPNTNAVMGSVEKKFYGVAASTLGTMRIVGQMLSMGIATLVFSMFIGKARITPASLPALPRRHEGLFRHFFCFMLRRRFLFPGQGKDALNAPLRLHKYPRVRSASCSSSSSAPPGSPAFRRPRTLPQHGGLWLGRPGPAGAHRHHRHEPPWSADNRSPLLPDRGAPSGQGRLAGALKGSQGQSRTHRARGRG